MSLGFVLLGPDHDVRVDEAVGEGVMRRVASRRASRSQVARAVEEWFAVGINPGDVLTIDGVIVAIAISGTECAISFGHQGTRPNADGRRRTP